MLNDVLIDAGPLIALFDKDDHYHEKVKEFIKNKDYKFHTTTSVITEVLHMLDFNVKVQINFLEWIMLGGILLYEIKQTDLGKIIELTKKYSDRPMDFADATLVLAAEQSGIRKIISIDSDFDIYRLPGKVRIENIFRDI
ncbi:type II toxin-antitoxin system VapC family toxin [Gracilinema caldarium]|uniref:PilT protein domain protein n=1 Tax=Gracilinema caldarium (strain ATCC 51460 / DSM 7334 / H1) TaxID=744872 RepID=F8F319_GRAC1|nr:PIN domain-containing protein [Gracilinema caldarium]AEJ19927.1 PilT protein domain protein [Gracilinema caldarium DSM 7334]